MSRHGFDTRHEDRRVRVVAGYDRPLDELFLQILVAPKCGRRDARRVRVQELVRAGGDGSDPPTLTMRLAELRIEPPATFLPAIFEDRRRRIINRLAFHHFDRGPEFAAARTVQSRPCRSAAQVVRP